MAGIHTAIGLTDNITTVLTNINNALNMTIGAFYDIQDASGNVDTSMFDAIQTCTSAATMALQNMREEALNVPDVDIEINTPDAWLQDVLPSTPIEVPVVWNADNFEVFTNTGVERYQQEIQSANSMMEQLVSTQTRIQEQAASLNFFPANMVNDISILNGRMTAIQTRIQQLQNNKMNDLGASRVNNEVERLRGQLSEMIGQQESLNTALDNMDVSAANAAYNRLNSIVASTERNIRDNVSAQEQFNNRVMQGQSAADGLTRKIMGMAAAYLSVQGAQKVLDLSDAIASNSARLELIVDDGGSVAELEQKIFDSSQRARGSFLATSQAVSKLGLLAGNAFSSTDEIIAFTELMNKNFAIGGASVQEQTSAMYQLTQAMAAGKLQGDEYRSIIENAPLLAGAIEQYMTDAGAEGTMKDWASEGLLTADVIKNALFSTVDETNERFNSMPMTFAQAAQNIKDNAIMAFQPVLNKLNEIANSQGFQQFMQKLSVAFSRLSSAILEIFDLAMATGQFISDNWSLIAPVIFGVVGAFVALNAIMLIQNAIAAISKGIKMASIAMEYAHAAAKGVAVSATTAETAAQMGLNAALLACPLTWILLTIVAIISVIYMVVGAINNFTGASVSATGIIFGAFAWLGSVIANIFFGLLEIVFGIVNYLVNPFIRFANFIGNLFVDPISSVIYLFQGMADGVLAVLQKIASAMDWIFGSHMADTVSDWREGLEDMADEAVRSRGYDPKDFNHFEELDLSVKSVLGIDRFDNTDAFMAGYDLGEGIADKVSGFFDFNLPEPPVQDDLLAGVQATAYNTDEMRKSMGMSADDLKYLRDIAERDVINRFTTAELKVDFSSSNTINSNMDIDGLVSDLEDRVTEVLFATAEGVHS